MAMFSFLLVVELGMEGSDFEFANSDCSNKHGAYGRHDILKIVMSY